MKKIISILLVLATIIGCCSLTGCKSNNETPTNNQPKPELTQDPLKGTVSTETFTKFNLSLIDYIDNNIQEGQNFMVSPLSFRYALALATIGANGDTQKELLKATGFETMNEYTAWCVGINNMVSKFEADFESSKKTYGEENVSDRKLMVANSVWGNSAYGALSKEYIEKVKDLYKAEAKSLPLNDFPTNINKWVNDNTNGLIDKLLSSVPDENTMAMLLNTLYLKSSWVNTFEDFNTIERKFVTYDNKVVKKDFMMQQSKFEYYEDDNNQIVVLPLEGGINVAFVLGNTDNIATELKKTNQEEVSVKIPKFEIETTLDNSQLINYLKENGVKLAFNNKGDADFSKMSDDFDLYISNITQKTKLKVHEGGLEAAAVTSIMMDGVTSVTDPVEPKVFDANKPFSFYIYGDGELTNELLFYGQYKQ